MQLHPTFVETAELLEGAHQLGELFIKLVDGTVSEIRSKSSAENQPGNVCQGDKAKGFIQQKYSFPDDSFVLILNASQLLSPI